MNILASVTCGGILEVDRMLPDIVSLIVTLIKIGVPILLIVFGMLDLGKAVMAQKEDEIKKSQQTFFVVVIVQTVFNLVGGSGKKNIWDCVNCFVNGAAADDDVEITTDCVTGK